MVVWGSSLGCPGPSKSSFRAGESLIFMFLQFQLSAGTFGSTWNVLGASWAQLGASWAPLGLNLGALGTNLAPTWALLGSTWRQLRRFWNQVGTNLSPLWAIMGDLVTLLDALRHVCWIKITPEQLPRAILGDLDSILSRYWLLWDRVWDVLDPQNRAPVQARA